MNKEDLQRALDEVRVLYGDIEDTVNVWQAAVERLQDLLQFELESEDVEEA